MRSQLLGGTILLVLVSISIGRPVSSDEESSPSLSRQSSFYEYPDRVHFNYPSQNLSQLQAWIPEHHVDSTPVASWNAQEGLLNYPHQDHTYNIADLAIQAHTVPSSSSGTSSSHPHHPGCQDKKIVQPYYGPFFRAKLGYTVYRHYDPPAPSNADIQAQSEEQVNQNEGSPVNQHPRRGEEGAIQLGNGYYTAHLDVPGHLNIFRGIDLIKQNPDNHRKLIKRLNHSIRRWTDPVEYAKKYEEYIQSARAFCWLTSGRFEQPGWSEREMLHKSPAVHAVYASDHTQDLIYYSKKEQLGRKREFRNRQLHRFYKFGREMGMGSQDRSQVPHNRSNLSLDFDLQAKASNEEEAQRDQYEELFQAGKLPRLHRDPSTGVFRLTKSRAEQMRTRLYPDSWLTDESNADRRAKMRRHNRKQSRKGIVKVLDQAPESSDEEYQRPRSIFRPADHNELFGPYPAPPNRQSRPYDPKRMELKSDRAN